MHDYVDKSMSMHNFMYIRAHQHNVYDVHARVSCLRDGIVCAVWWCGGVVVCECDALHALHSMQRMTCDMQRMTCDTCPAATSLTKASKLSLKAAAPRGSTWL